MANKSQNESSVSSKFGGEVYYGKKSVWNIENFKSENELRRFRTVESLIPHDIKNLCDIGAGNGAFLAYMEECRSHIRLTGVEPSFAAIQSAVSKAQILQGNAQQLPFNDRHFDMISILEVLEHIPHPFYQEVLSELVRVASRYIIVSVPYREKRRNVRCPYCSCSFHAFYHIRSFEEKDLAELFPKFKLVTVERVPVFERLPVPSPLWLKNSLFIHPIGGAVCPVCGYVASSKGEVSPVAEKINRWASLKTAVKDAMPCVKKYRWAVALYRREVPQSSQ